MEAILDVALKVIIWAGVLFFIFLMIRWRIRWLNDFEWTTCYWCKGSVGDSRLNLKRKFDSYHLDPKKRQYCSGKCVNADHASRGIKENRERYIIGE